MEREGERGGRREKGIRRAGVGVGEGGRGEFCSLFKSTLKATSRRLRRNKGRRSTDSGLRSLASWGGEIGRKLLVIDRVKKITRKRKGDGRKAGKGLVVLRS